MRFVFVCVLAAGCGAVSFKPGEGEFPSAPTPDWAHTARFAITENRSDTITFITATDPSPKLLADIPVGDNPVELEGPHHVDVSPDGKYLYYNLSNYVPGTGSGPHGSHGTGTVPGSLVKIDAITGAKVGEVLIDRSPGDVILSPDGTLAFVTHYDLLKVIDQQTNGGPPENAYSTLAVVETQGAMRRLSLTPVCPTAHGEGLSPDQSTIYVTCTQSDEIVAVDVRDPAHPQVLKHVPVGPAPGKLGFPVYGPYALTVSPKDGTVWVSDNNSADVRVYDPKTQQMDPARTVMVNGVTMFGAFSLDGNTYYVPHQGDDVITRIDVATLAKTDLPTPKGSCLNAHALKLAPGGQSAVLVCEGDHVQLPGTAVAVSLVPFAVTGYVKLALFPDGAALIPAL